MGVFWRNPWVAVNRLRRWSVGLMLLASVLLISSQLSYAAGPAD